jgi:hypothetical protein
MPIKFGLWIVITSLVFMAVCACATITETPPTKMVPAPVNTAVPEPTKQPAPQPTEKNNPPSGGPIGGVPAAPNLSIITAKVIAANQSDQGLVLTIEVQSSQKQDGFADFGSAVIGQQIDAQVNDDPGTPYTAGQIIQAGLVYQGDEHGGIYFLQNILNQ